MKYSVKEIASQGSTPFLKNKDISELKGRALRYIRMVTCSKGNIWIGYQILLIKKLRGYKKVSKTDIVEQAIENATKDFKLKIELGKLDSNKAIIIGV